MIRLFLLFTIFAGALVSQEFGSVRGKLTDAETGEPLPYGNVSLEGTILGTVANHRGEFRISKIPVGTHVLSASYIGYHKRSQSVIVSARDSAFIEFQLIPSGLTSEEIVVSAARKEQTSALAPASVAVVTDHQIQSRNAVTFDQTLEGVGGLSLTRSSLATVQAVSIRGSSDVAGGGAGNRVLLLIDGRPALSPESGGALWSLVPIGAIERIEIVKGAYSSLYGSSAMGGVVNVITKRPASETRTTLRTSYGFYDRPLSYTGYDRYKDFSNFGVTRSGPLGYGSYLVDANLSRSDGYKEQSAFRMINLFGKWNYPIASNRNLQISSNLNLLRNETPATWLSTLQPYHVAAWRKDDTQRKLEWSGDVSYHAIVSKEFQYRTRFYSYLQNTRYVFDGDPKNDSTNVNIGHQDVPREGIETHRIGNVTQLDRYAGRHYWIAGMESQFDRTYAWPSDLLYGRHRAYNLAGYIQDEIALSDRWTTTFGIRYDYNKITDGFGEGNISPKAATVYRVTEAWSVRALVAQAFRNPSIAERYIQYEQGGGLYFRQNPDLRSEKLYLSAELGTKILAGEFAEFDVSVFSNRYRNLISYVQVNTPPDPLLFEIRNLNRVLMQGVEVETSFRYSDRVRASAGYVYLDARDLSGASDNTLAYKVRHAFHFSVDGTYGRFSLNVNGRANSRIEKVFIYPGSEPDAFTVVNAKLSIETNPFRFSTGVNNLFNRQYEEIERYRMPNRSFIIEMIVRL